MSLINIEYCTFVHTNCPGTSTLSVRKNGYWSAKRITILAAFCAGIQSLRKPIDRILNFLSHPYVPYKYRILYLSTHLLPWDIYS